MRFFLFTKNRHFIKYSTQTQFRCKEHATLSSITKINFTYVYDKLLRITAIYKFKTKRLAEGVRPEEVTAITQSNNIQQLHSPW